MHFQFDIASTSKPAPLQPPLPPEEMVPHLLHQMLELQRDQLGQVLEVQKAHLHHVRAASQDQVMRWRQILSRCDADYVNLMEDCKRAYPILEKAFVKVAMTLVEELAEQGDDSLDSDFAVQEFLDRYGAKLGQLSHLLGIIGPMTEAAQQNEAAKQQQQAQQQQTPPP